MLSLVAGIGPRPINDGSTPHVAHETILTKGSMLLNSASSLLIKTKAAAPSFSPEEFPAVTVPLSLKTVFKEFKFFNTQIFSWIFIFFKRFQFYYFFLFQKLSIHL